MGSDLVDKMRLGPVGGQAWPAFIGYEDGRLRKLLYARAAVGSYSRVAYTQSDTDMCFTPYDGGGGYLEEEEEE